MPSWHYAHMPKHDRDSQQMGKPIRQTHIKWYALDRKLLAAIKQAAKEADRNFSQQVKFYLRKATGEPTNGAARS